MLLHLIFSILAILVAVKLVAGVSVTLVGAIILAIVLGVINMFIKPVVKFITLPINVLTLGLFSLIINGAFIYLAGMIVPGFQVASFWIAVLFGIVLSLINAFFDMFDNKYENNQIR